MSFCRDAADMHEARRVAQAAGSDAALVAKVERTEAIANLGEIIDASDVVMVARGDLGVEIGDAELPACRSASSANRWRASGGDHRDADAAVDGRQPDPHRAEVLDVANAVIDGTDAVMLSQETAAGQHPVAAVEAMARICLGAERSFERDTDFEAARRGLERADQAIAMAAMFLSEHIGVGAIVAMTESGGTARFLSRFRSNVPIHAFSRHGGARSDGADARRVPVGLRQPRPDPREAARGSVRTWSMPGCSAPATGGVHQRRAHGNPRREYVAPAAGGRRRQGRGVGELLKWE